jgi:hypothetical protein
MFPFPIATPQGCNIQTFYGFGTNVGNSSQRTWSKPVGVSHVYMMLIGAGGNGDGSSNGGGSGAVTVWYGAAQHVPNLVYIVSTGQGSQHPSQIYFDSGQVIILLQAEPGSNATGGAATTAPAFAASGFYKSTAGQNAATTQTASTTTFLGGGGGSAITGNYGYTVSDNRTGFFQMQPIIVGVGTSAGGANAGVGCGAGYSSTGGGQGMVLIASW